MVAKAVMIAKGCKSKTTRWNEATCDRESLPC